MIALLGELSMRRSPIVPGILLFVASACTGMPAVPPPKSGTTNTGDPRIPLAPEVVAAQQGDAPAESADEEDVRPYPKKGPPQPPPKCDPVAFVAPAEGYVGQDEPYGTAQEIDDLDGDGTKEIAVSYPTSRTSNGVTIISPTKDRYCYRKVYEGEGSYSSARATKTNTYRDIELSVDVMLPQSRGWARVLLAYDGSTYRWKETLKCDSVSGPVPPSTCPVSR
jgi:hypothetical protein